MTVTDPAPTVQTSDPSRHIPTRRMSFEESLRDLPRHFSQDGDLIGSHVIATLSSVFPDGEDFFVRSVRHYRDQIVDPDLRRQVAGFIGQEAVHGREHRVLNDKLAELGYSTKRLERWTRKGLAIRSKVAPPISNLAATAALEHFTATLAEVILTDEQARDMIGHEAVKEVFVWHALEESEHKAVAFDVYRAVGGSERLRVVTMKLTRIGFVVGMGIEIVIGVLRDPRSREKGVLRASWRKFRRSPFLSKELWRQLKEYDAPDFHPDDRDTDALVETWRATLFGEHGTLNDKLASRAA